MLTFLVDPCPGCSDVLILGSYTRQGALLSFTPDEADAPLFTGTSEGEYIREVGS